MKFSEKACAPTFLKGVRWNHLVKALANTLQMIFRIGQWWNLSMEKCWPSPAWLGFFIGIGMSTVIWCLWSLPKMSPVAEACCSMCMLLMWASKPSSSSRLKFGAWRTSCTSLFTFDTDLSWLPVKAQLVRHQIDIFLQGHGDGGPWTGSSDWQEGRCTDVDRLFEVTNKSGSWDGWWWYSQAMPNLLNCVWKELYMTNKTCLVVEVGAACRSSVIEDSGRRSQYLAGSLQVHGLRGYWDDEAVGSPPAGLAGSSCELDYVTITLFFSYFTRLTTRSSHCTLFSPFSQDAFCLNAASILSCRAWPHLLLSIYGRHFLSCVTTYTAFFPSIAWTTFPFISILVLSLRTLLGPCAGLPHIYIQHYLLYFLSNLNLLNSPLTLDF